MSCFLFAIFFLVLRSSLDEVNARISPAWILVFWVSRRIMMGQPRKPVELADDLRAMIADSVTTEDRRQEAREKLTQLETKGFIYVIDPI
ncbi:MAG: hypothetical protein J0I69_11295 [Altererythrobacter sp.]|nr:hypothetical protein [Altererythrobacter sp.]OJU60544.1 MAG: hypothetical protein BGO08_10120 [Altererythrobacter sp. 66-12]